MPSIATMIDSEWQTRGNVRERTLAREVQGLAGLCRKLRLRMGMWLRQSEAAWLAEHPDADRGDGPMPDQDFRETFDTYQKGVLGLLKEQRERAVIAIKSSNDGRAAILSDEQYQEELRGLAKDAIRAMPRTELESLLKERIDLDRNKAPARKS